MTGRPSTVKHLFTLSGNRCAFPRPSISLIDERIGKICHVRAARPGGPRYHSTQSDVDRNSFETPIPRENCRLGAPPAGYWFERLNSDAMVDGDSGQGNIGGVEAAPLPAHGRAYSLSLTLPTLDALFLRHSRNSES